MRPLSVAAASFGAAAIIAGGLAPVASAAPAGYSCSPGYFCMYSGWNGTGTRCQYKQKTRDTAAACSFIRNGRNVRSVHNANRHTATYYTGTNYGHRIGSTKPSQYGNLQGSYQIRSIKF